MNNALATPTSLEEWLAQGPHSVPLALSLGLGLLLRLERETPPGGLSAERVSLRGSGSAIEVSVDQRPGSSPVQAPERAGSIARPLGTPALLYELGLLLYHAVCGRPPFPGTDSGQLLERQLRVTIEPLPASLPRSLRALILRLLEPDPRDRYQSLAGVRADLERLEAGDRTFCIGCRDWRTDLALPDFAGGMVEVEALFDRLREQRQLNFVGASGCGKSRLLEELGELGRARGWALIPLRGEPLARNISQSLAPLLHDCQSIEVCAESAREAGDLLASLAAPSEVPGVSGVLSESLLEARLEALFRSLPLGKGCPVLMLVDDSQWLGAPLLGALAHAREKEPNLAVVTASRADGSTLAADLTLDGLSENALSELLQSMAGPLPASVLDHLVSRSGGSPFLAVEGLRGWVEGGLLTASASGWVEVDNLHGQASSRAGTLLAQRLDLLGSEDERVLAAAAVLGRAVLPEATAEILSAHVETVLQALERAEDQRLLWSSRDHGLAFCHDRIREELEARLSPEQRRQVHLQAGLWWESTVPDEVYRQAYHFQQAGQSEKARPPALLAARAARRAGDLALAERCFRIVLEGGQEQGCQRELAEVLVSRGTEFEEARELLRSALESCSSALESALVEAALAALEYRRDQPALALEHLRRAIRQLGGPWPGKLDLFPRLLLQVGISYFRQIFPWGLHQKAVEDPVAFELGIELYKRAAETAFELSDIPLVVWAHYRLLNDTERYLPTPQLGNLYSYHLALMAGEFKSFRVPAPHWRAGLKALEQSGSPHQQGKAGVWISMRHFLAGRFDRAERTARRTLAALHEAGDQWELQIALGLLSNITYQQGRLDQALEMAQNAYVGAVRWNNPLAAARALLAWAQAGEGAVPEELIEDQVRHVGSSVYRLFELYQAEAARLAGLGRYLEAVSSLDMALSVGKPATSFRALALPWKATWYRLAYDQAAGSRRAELLRLARRAARESLDLNRGRPAALAHALREAGLMAARRGNVEVARLHLAESLQVADQQGQLRERALTLAARGQIGQALGWPGAEAEAREASRWLTPSAPPDSPALKARFAILLETAGALLQSPSQDDALNRAAEALRFMLRAEQAWVVVGPPERARALEGHAPLSTELYRQSLLRKQVLAVAAPEEDAVLVRHGARSAMYVRIGPQAAILLVHSRVRDLFAAEDLALCDFLGQLTGAALDNHRVIGELRDSEVRFRTLFENAGVGLQLISLEGQLLASNDYLQQSLSLGPLEGATLDPLALVESEDRDQERQLLDQLLAGQRDVYSLFLRHRRRNGSSAWTQVTSSLIRTASGQPARVVRAISDVSSRHLERVIDFGEQQHQMLALDLHDTIAQQLVMAGQKSYLQPPEKALEAVREELKAAVFEVRSLHRDLASPRSSRRSYRKALRDYLINFSAHERAIELDWRLHRSPGAAWPRGLPGLFAYRIVCEALTNVRHHAQASRVRVRLKVSAGRLRGEVLDDGVGLTAPSQERAHLGLAGIRLRCELLGGRCQVSGLPNGGTRIRFILPTERLS